MSNFRNGGTANAHTAAGVAPGGSASGHDAVGDAGKAAASSSVTRPGPLMATGHGPRGASEGHAKSGPGSAAPLMDASNVLHNHQHHPSSTLLKSRRDQQHHVSGSATGSAQHQQPQLHCQQDGTGKPMTKAPSGKDISLAQKSVLNLQNVSKSVERQASNAGGAPSAAQKGALMQGTQQ